MTKVKFNKKSLKEAATGKVETTYSVHTGYDVDYDTMVQYENVFSEYFGRDGRANLTLAEIAENVALLGTDIGAAGCKVDAEHNYEDSCLNIKFFRGNEDVPFFSLIAFPHTDLDAIASELQSLVELIHTVEHYTV